MPNAILNVVDDERREHFVVAIAVSIMLSVATRRPSCLIVKLIEKRSSLIHLKHPILEDLIRSISFDVMPLDCWRFSKITWLKRHTDFE